MHAAEVTWHQLLTRTWRVRLLEAASRAARSVSRYSLSEQDHAAALRWKQRQLWFDERARFDEASSH